VWTTWTCAIKLSQFEEISVRNFPFATRVCIAQVFRASTFGKSPGRMAVAQVIILAGSQHRCSVGRAEALNVCLRCVEIFEWKKITEKNECSECYQTRPPGWEYSLS